MIRLARYISPHSPVISIRGKIVENGKAMFIQREKDRSSIETIKREAKAIHMFLDSASIQYSFYRNHVVGIGYSDGAAMAVAISFLFPSSVKGLILFRVFSPFNPTESPDLVGLKALVVSGKYDCISKPSEAGELVKLMSGFGAKVEHVLLETGHEIARQDAEIAKDWLIKNFSV
jgi:phospholipase/carboxylesterase